MIWRRRALSWCLVAMMARSEYSAAGVWGMDPVVGVLGDVSSNPALLYQRDTAVASAAVKIDDPTVYDGGDLKFNILPSFRFGDSHGYSSVASDYAHLNASGELDSERSTFTAGAGITRDSSLGYDYLSSGSVGVRRDASSADMNWDRHLTERVEFDIDGNVQRVHFGQSFGTETLTDYEYTAVAPALSRNLSERIKVTLTGGVGRYDSLDTGTPFSTESRSSNLQIGFESHLSELWTLKTLAGYSRALNRVYGNIPIPLIGGGVYVFHFDEQSTQNSSVYDFDLAHQSERLMFDATASRQLTPTGFAFLSRQDLYETKFNYKLSERWSFGGDAKAQRYQNPPANGVFPNVNVKYLNLNGNWNWTEYWTVSLAAARITETGQGIHVASNELTLTFSRRFNHITLQ